MVRALLLSEKKKIKEKDDLERLKVFFGGSAQVSHEWCTTDTSSWLDFFAGF